MAKEGAGEQAKEAPKKESGGGGSGGKKGVYEPLPGGCQSRACKTPAKRFGFCDEHFEQFKFGLITKKGEHVPDYEKKYEHYQAYVAKKKSSRAA